MPRFYLDVPLALHDTLVLPETVFRHAVQVLRLQIGEPLILFNGQGGEYVARLTEIGKRQAHAMLESFQAEQRESPLRLTLAQAMIKPDKMDFALQKAVELGIHAFQPLLTKRSVVQVGKEKLERKLEHWQAVAISACEQSGRCSIPTILPPASLDSYLRQNTADATEPSVLRLMLAPEVIQRFSDLPPPPMQAVDVLIGPEGGFIEEEVLLCHQVGIQTVSLGPRILRAETASITALSLLQQRYGDF